MNYPQWPLHGEVPPGEYQLGQDKIVVEPPKPGRNAQVRVEHGFFSQRNTAIV